MYGGKQWQKQQNGILAEIRRREMLEILNAQGHATVTELCGHFQVSRPRFATTSMSWKP